MGRAKLRLSRGRGANPGSDGASPYPERLVKVRSKKAKGKSKRSGAAFTFAFCLFYFCLSPASPTSLSRGDTGSREARPLRGGP
jgi:hypothetical protein